jgi:hypothetical protein
MGSTSCFTRIDTQIDNNNYYLERTITNWDLVNNMSELKVNKISPRSGTDVTLGDSGDTFTVPAGASIVNNGTATGFGATGAVNWDTTAKTTGFTAVSGVGYFCDTTSAGFTVTLPATPSAGDIVGLVDYAGTFDTNALTIDPNGEDIEGGTDNLLLTGEREGVVLLYVDSTQGWLAISGINEGTDALEPVSYSIDFLVVAGGGGGGQGNYGGGGGAGGYRTSTQSVTVGTTITVTVGDGGTAPGPGAGGAGSNSSISGTGLTTITSAGGGGGGGDPSIAGLSGGSGSGGGAGIGSGTGGSGNTPSTAPSQGNNGANGNGSGGGGGGGAGEAGNTDAQSEGGDGVASSITGSSVVRAGGGGGNKNAGTGVPGGDGGGGASANPGTAGTINTGGGGGAQTGGPNAGAGGKGVVILSMPLASFSGTTTGSPTESDDGTTKVLIFNGDGSYTA